MEWWAWTLIVIAIVLICSGVCEGGRRYHSRGVILHPTPVIVTSSTHTTAAGPYPVTVTGPPATITQTGAPYGQPGVYPMPQAQHGGYPAPYPPAQQQQTPYPPTSSAVGMPMPTGIPTTMNPPTYDQVVGGDAYQKQSPYNPNYGGN